MLSCRGYGFLRTSSSNYTICVASLQERLGLTTKGADFSAVWLTRDQFRMTFLDQLDLMDMGDLLELSKGLSKIGAKIFEGVWFKIRTSFWSLPPLCHSAKQVFAEATTNGAHPLL